MQRRRSISLNAGFVLAAPTLVFLLMVPTVLGGGHRKPVAPAPEPTCGAPTLALPATCTQPYDEPCERCAAWSCRVGPDWTVPVTLTGLEPECRYRLVGRDRQLGPSLHPAIDKASPLPCEAGVDALVCRVALAPVSPLHLALVGAPRDEAGAPEALAAEVVVLVARDGLLDVRASALGRIALVLALSLAMSAALAALSRRLRTRARAWPVTGALAALGGMGSATLFTLAPADVGGFDVFRPERLAWLLPSAAAFGFAFGPAIAAARAAYQVRTGEGRAYLVLATIVFAIATSLHLQWSMSENTSIGATLEIKDGFYCALGIALTLPLITSPARRARGLVGGALASALLLAVVAVTAIELAAPRTHPQLAGFHKPTSAFMVLVVLLPHLSSLALAVTLSPERPSWLLRSQDLLLRCLAPADGPERTARARALARELCQHADAIAETRAAELAALAFFAPRILGPREIWERAGLTRDLDQGDARLAAAIAALVARGDLAPPRARELDANALDPAARGRVRVTLVAAPIGSELTVVTLRDGALDPDPARLVHTRALVVHALHTLEPGGAGDLIAIDLMPDPAPSPPTADRAETWYRPFDPATRIALAGLMGRGSGALGDLPPPAATLALRPLPADS